MAVERDSEVEVLVSAYGTLIRRIVRRIGGAAASQIEDDVHQNVVIGLWRQLERGQTLDRPASYIFRAAIRETLRLLRRLAAQTPPGAIDPDLAASGDRDPHRQLEDKQRQRMVAEAIATLAPPRQQAVRAHLAGFDVKEIMEMFGWSYQRARHLIARGMADLRRELRERGGHE